MTPPLSVTHSDDAQLVLTALDHLIEHGTPSQRRHAYDLLIRLGASFGSDCRPRIHITPPGGQT